jgi:hypothetical protein
MSYRFNPFTNAFDRVGKVFNYIRTRFTGDICVPANKVLILKDPIVDGDMIIDGELYLL